MALEKLTFLEDKIISVISITFPFTKSKCEYIYRKCKSFDKTINILTLSISKKIDIDLILKDKYDLKLTPVSKILE